MIENQIFITDYNTPFGKITMAACNDALCGLWFVGQKHYCANISNDAPRYHNHPVFIRAQQWIDAYFNGIRPKISDLSLAPHGTEFQRSVWRALCEIPYGMYVTYTDIATRVGCPKSVRAVGGAIGRNPISIIIPCHRVIGANGKLTGYAAGIQTKIKLLQHEGVI